MESVVYILFYIGLSLIVPLSVSKNTRKLYTGKLILALIVFCTIKGFIYDTATDYMGYYNFYVNGISQDSEHMESLFKIVISILSSICSSPFLFFSICALLNTIVMLEIGKFYDNSQKEVLLIWPIFMLSLSLNLYRQYIALAFIVLFFLHLQKRNWLRAFVFAIVSTGFHTSAMIGVGFILVANFLSRYNINKIWFILGIITTTILSSFFLEKILAITSFFSLFYQQKTGQLYDASRIFDTAYAENTLQFYNMLISCIFIWCIDKTICNEQKYKSLYYLFAIGQIIAPIMREQILIRLCLYITVFTPVILGVTLKYIRRNTFVSYLFAAALFYHVCYFIVTEYRMEEEFPLLFAW